MITLKNPIILFIFGFRCTPFSGPTYVTAKPKLWTQWFINAWFRKS